MADRRAFVRFVSQMISGQDANCGLEYRTRMTLKAEQERTGEDSLT